MNKLLHLKKWVSLEEAAIQITEDLSGPVSIEDLYQLALERQLIISINIVNQTCAKLGKIFPYSEVPKLAMPPLLIDGVSVDTKTIVPDGYLVQDGITAADSLYLRFRGPIKWIDGVWDLSMVGDEKFAIAELLHSRDSIAVEMFNVEGSILKQENGTYAQLQREFDTDSLPEEARKSFWELKHHERYYPMTGLPNNAPLVIRTNELIEFIARSQKTGIQKKSLTDKERTSYLNIIGALLGVLKENNKMSESEIIRFLVDKGYNEYQGVSKRNLENVFSLAKRSIGEKD